MFSIKTTENLNSTIIIENFIENQSLYKLISPYIKGNIIFFVDKNIKNVFLSNIKDIFLNHNIEINVIYINALEKNKSIKYALKLLNNLNKFAVNKNTTLIAIGGGMVLDITGFIASILLRGLPLIYIPTTFLAMIDSSIGGKNGINSNFGKNSLGTFYHPQLILIDSYFLKSLPAIQLHSGFFECLKYAILFDKLFFDQLVNLQPLFINGNIVDNLKTINNIIYQCCNFKVSVVNQDFKENHNYRQLLNLGHTIGHALETYTNYKKILHGHAVGIGIYYIAKLSYQLNLLQKNDYLNIINNIDIVNLSKNLPKINIIKLIKIIKQDKKNTNNNLNIVLINSIGKCEFKKNIDTLLVQKFLTQEFNKFN